MNNEDLLKALGKFTPQEIAEAIARQAKAKTIDNESKTIDNDPSLVQEGDLLPKFDVEDKFSESSYDRKLLREFLSVNKLAELHTWWDGSSFAVFNNWLFTSDMELELELVNKDQEKKYLRLKVSL